MPAFPVAIRYKDRENRFERWPVRCIFVRI